VRGDAQKMKQMRSKGRHQNLFMSLSFGSGSLGFATGESPAEAGSILKNCFGRGRLNAEIGCFDMIVIQ